VKITRGDPLLAAATIPANRMNIPSEVLTV